MKTGDSVVAIARFGRRNYDGYKHYNMPAATAQLVGERYAWPSYARCSSAMSTSSS
jgi:hypothetical protein